MGDAAAHGVEIAEVTIAAYGISEHKTVTAPVEWHGRIEALSAVTQYGPNYQRRVVDTLDSLMACTRIRRVHGPSRASGPGRTR